MPAPQITRFAVPGPVLIVPPRFGDDRGFFSETYNQAALAEVGIDLTFMQDNHSWSKAAGVVRGLHFQAPPVAQDKLIRVSRGRVLDVAVDIRRGSPTYGRHVAAELSAENWAQLLVPAGFAHGFQTLSPDTEVQYKVTAPYAPETEGGVLWNDPALGIDWPLAAEEAVLSAKDQVLPTLAELDSPFIWSQSS